MNNEKLQALAQHLGIEFFEYNGELFTGESQDEFDKRMDSLDEEYRDGVYVHENYTLLEDEFTEGYDENHIEYGKQEYLVLTDDEADVLWDESLESYIDDCILPEIPKAYRSYFDNEKWKRDAKYDGRGHSLSSYDGNENEERVEGTYYFIYRTN